jgi:hypothetical protein
VVARVPLCASPRLPPAEAARTGLLTLNLNPQKPLAHLLRVVLIFPVVVPLFGPRARAVGGTAWTVYDNIIKARAARPACCARRRVLCAWRTPSPCLDVVR